MHIILRCSSKQCKLAMQCSDGELILASLLCDSMFDCSDYSDELSLFGFKCEENLSDYNCYLPQINLYDDVAHCNDGSDLCLTNNNSCFECSDKFLLISANQKCDGCIDCLNATDERSCGYISNSACNTFRFQSSELLSSVTRYAFWIIGCIVLVGNSVVIVTILRLLWTTRTTDSLKLQHFIILNIACADFIMGIYLLTIATHSEIYSGRYNHKNEIEWRTSLRCSIIGSLAVISSQASCFLMVILTSFRLYNICNPTASLTSPALTWKIGLCAAWLMAVLIAVVPIVFRTLEYFVSLYYISNWFHPQGIIDSKRGLTDFAIKYSVLRGQIDEINLQDFDSIRNYLEASFPRGLLREFGYYADSSACLPRWFADRFTTAWEYTMAVVTINFCAFLYIGVGYITMYVKSTAKSNELGRNVLRREKRMQKRIARIILTDFCCWIPICVMSYLQISQTVYYTTEMTYQITATFLLPINSALNPFLFSSLPDKLWKKMRCRTCRQ